MQTDSRLQHFPQLWYYIVASKMHQRGKVLYTLIAIDTVSQTSEHTKQPIVSPALWLPVEYTEVLLGPFLESLPEVAHNLVQRTPRRRAIPYSA